MTPYWKRLLVSAGIVVAIFVPAMIIHTDPSLIIGGPWFGVVVIMETYQTFPDLDLSTPTWSVVLVLLTAAVLSIASRWRAVAVLTLLFFLVNALFLYVFLSADIGHA